MTFRAWFKLGQHLVKIGQATARSVFLRLLDVERSGAGALLPDVMLPDSVRRVYTVSADAVALRGLVSPATQGQHSFQHTPRTMQCSASIRRRAVAITTTTIRQQILRAQLLA